MSERSNWREIRDEIHRMIVSGRFRPGDKLPRDVDIAAELHCGRSTVQRAMQDLAERGLIERRRKGGTSVRLDPVTRAKLEIPDTRKEVESRGFRYGYQLIDVERKDPPETVKSRLGRDLAPMLRVQALHLANANAYMLEDRWINLETAPDALEVDFSHTSANEWLIANKSYDAVDMRFYAENAGRWRGELLNTPPEMALLVLERTTWIEKRPITLVKVSTAPGYQLISHSG